MPVEMLIRGRHGKIRQEDWNNAVLSRKDLRANAAGNVVKNPKTGAEIRVPGNDGDVDFYFKDLNRWIKVFSWFEGVVLFKATGNCSEEVLHVAFALAKLLDADVTDEEGNICEP